MDAVSHVSSLTAVARAASSRVSTVGHPYARLRDYRAWLAPWKRP